MAGCTHKGELGTAANPIKMSLVPGQDVAILTENGNSLEKWLKNRTGFEIKINVPVSYVAVIESLGSKKADLAIMNTFGYLVAHEKYGASAGLIGLNNDTDEYRGQIISLKSGPKNINELNGKKFAFVDPISTSGYVLAAKLLKDEKVKLKDYIFAGRHDLVVQMVYQGRVDAGASFYSEPQNGEPQDARRLVKTQYPDVYDKVVIIGKTAPIPNDPVVFRKDLPPEVRQKLTLALIDYFKEEEGRKVMFNLYHMSGMKLVDDGRWNSVRKTLLEIGKSAQDFIK